MKGITQTRATISDVARLANVSVATVSRVMNSTRFVNEQASKRVWDAVRELSYEPNQSARNLRKNESGAILVIAPNLTNPYYAQIQGGIVETMRRYGYSAFVCSTMGEQARAVELIRMLEKHQADGAVVMAIGSQDTWLAEYVDRYPIVLSSEYNPDLQIPRVSIDNYAAAFEAIEYLISLGHREIAIISAVNDYISTRLRVQGYQDALQKHRLPCRLENVAYASVDYSFSSGEAETKRLLSRPNRPTAIFCISDVLAMGAIYGARELSLEVPRDVSVMGIDDLDYATMLRPRITTVAQPCHEIGVRCAETLMDRIMGKEPSQQIMVLPHRLIERDSCAPPDGKSHTIFG